MTQLSEEDRKRACAKLGILYQSKSERIDEIRRKIDELEVKLNAKEMEKFVNRFSEASRKLREQFFR